MTKYLKYMYVHVINFSKSQLIIFSKIHVYKFAVCSSVHVLGVRQLSWKGLARLNSISIFYFLGKEYYGKCEN